jgi:hypothetical protein
MEKDADGPTSPPLKDSKSATEAASGTSEKQVMVEKLFRHTNKFLEENKFSCATPPSSGP